MTKPSVLVLTGTEAAGKTSLANRLVSSLPGKHVVAVTTRQPRADDHGHYKYVNATQFGRYEAQHKLALSTTYRDERYGILLEDLRVDASSGQQAIVSITPESVGEFLTANSSEFSFISVFLDASDEELDDRLIARNSTSLPDRNRRARDRRYDSATTLRFSGGSIDAREKAVRLILDSDGRTGVLPYQWISRLIESGTLLTNAEIGNVQGASYDLRLGDEYFYGGRIRTLSKSKPILVVEPYDYAIVTSLERADMSRDLTGRFDLSVGLFSQGVILSNGPQIDPGFRGNLFCLLFNTSSSPVLLRRGQHYATIEFHRLIEATDRPYVGPRQGKDSILDYLPANAARGAINELKKELEQLRKDSSRLQTFFIGALSLMFAVAALLIATR